MYTAKYSDIHVTEVATTSSSNETGIQSSLNNGDSDSNITTIVAGTVGGLFFAFVLFLGFYVFRRRIQKTRMPVDTTAPLNDPVYENLAYDIEHIETQNKDNAISGYDNA